MWYLDSGPESEDYPYKGRIQKLTTLTASFAASFFKDKLRDYLPDKAAKKPFFDCREVPVPNLSEACNHFVWRQSDARKNAVSMAAQSVYKQRELNGVSQRKMLTMLAEVGINFEQYPTFFKRGSFVLRQEYEEELTPEELEKIPVLFRPTGPVRRASILARDFPLFAKLPTEFWQVVLTQPARIRVEGDEVFIRNEL